MDNESDATNPEEEGDGLPNMQLRLRVIAIATLSGVAAWAAVYLLI